ncbi:MAG: histone deacetylase [Opitutales bacterium]|nr:histone deacetylase [Opitutales bacterium]
MLKVAFLYAEEFADHDTGQQHPETAERARWIASAVRRGPLGAHVGFIEPRAVPSRWIDRVHTADYRRFIEEAALKGLRSVDFGETLVSPESFEVARLAAGAALGAVEAACSGRWLAAFACCRPPGHHARTEQAMGFCLFNNVAIAAVYAREALGRERVCIIDWDVHHGNGTQESFYASPGELFISIHQHPLYPHTGWREERGSGAGAGFNLNLPVPAGATGEDYRRLWDEQVVPAVEAFQPNLLLISCGFDAHRLDPLSAVDLEEADYYDLTRRAWNLARSFPDCPVVSVLEGGYHPDALVRSALFHLCGLAEGDAEGTLLPSFRRAFLAERAGG